MSVTLISPLSPSKKFEACSLVKKLSSKGRLPMVITLVFKMYSPDFPRNPVPQETPHPSSNTTCIFLLCSSFPCFCREKRLEDTSSTQI